jgi:glycine oxidase
LTTTKTTDVLIVGAGVMGLSLAWELSRRGIRAAILERGDVGREASWAGAGMIPPRISEHPHSDSAAPLQNLLALSRELHPRWSAELRELTDIDNEYRRCGAWYLAADDTEAAALRTQYEAWAAAGTTSTWHNRVNLPPLLSPTWHAGYFAADEAQIRNPRHLRALLAAVTMSGVPIETQTEPRSIIRRGERTIDVQTDAGRWSAAHVCLCGGAWSAALGRMLDVELPVQPIRGQMLLLDSALEIPSIINHGPRYIVPRRDRLTLVGSTEEDAGFVKENTAAGLSELRAFAVQTIPALADATELQSWSGLRPASARPWISRLPGWSNAWTAAGHYRHGLALSPGTAVAMAALICGEQPPLEMEWFQLQR